MRARSGTRASLGEPARRSGPRSRPERQTFCLVARAMTSAKLRLRPSWLQCRCSQRWQEANRTGVPSVRVMASAVTRSLPHSGQSPDGVTPACVSDAGCATGVAVEGLAVRWTGIIRKLPGGRRDLMCVGGSSRGLEYGEVSGKSDRQRSAGRAQDAQVTAPAGPLAGPRVGRRVGGRAGGLPDSIGERLEVVTARQGGGHVDVEPDDLPAEWCGQPLRVLLAQVVGVRLG